MLWMLWLLVLLVVAVCFFLFALGRAAAKPQPNPAELSSHAPSAARRRAAESEEALSAEPLQLTDAEFEEIVHLHSYGRESQETAANLPRPFHDQAGCCFYCGSEMNGTRHLDHKTPVSRGGTDQPENLCWACELCSREKGERTAEEYSSYLATLRRRPERTPGSRTFVLSRR